VPNPSAATPTAVGAAAYDLATVLGVTASNVAVQATITLTSGEAAGLVANYSGSGDASYYFGSILSTGSNSYQANLYRVVNGVYTALFSQSYTGTANGLLRLEVYGSSLKLFLSGTLVAYGTDATLSGGSVGIRTNTGAALSGFSASVLSVATPTLPFSDSFETPSTPEANQLTSNWINQVGNFSVNSTNGTATGFGGYDLATVVGLTAPNVNVQASITLTTGQAAGLVADYTGTGDGSYYFGSVQALASGLQANLYRVVHGVYTQIYTQSYTGSANGTLQFQVYDGSLQLFLNGNLIAYGNDTTLTGGSVGIRANAGATLANFSAST
jgi:hypothetical protein